MISVILPTHNRANLVGQAIESVLSQTYKDFELIVVDDGSTDNTEAILRPYLPMIHYIYQPNGGSGRARNSGLKAARGEYVAFIDDDDIWLPFKLELQIEFFQKHPELALICTNFKVFNSKNEYDSYIKNYFGLFKRTGLDFDVIFQNKKLLSSNKDSSLGPESKYFYYGNVFPTIFQGSFILQVSVMARKNIFQKIGMYNESLLTNEDYDLCIRICQIYEIGYIDIDTLKVRLAENTRSNDDGTRTIFWENNLSIIKSALSQSENIKKLDQQSIKTRLSLMYFKIAYYALGEGENTKSRTNLKKLISISPMEVKLFVMFLATFLPPPFMPWARSVRKKLRNLYLHRK